jgi:2-methylcitrate dehydratase PrpD
MSSTASTTNSAAPVLARFAAGLRYDDIPAAIRERARQCLVDAVACAMFGMTLPWSKILLAQQTGLDAKAGFLPLGSSQSLSAVREAALAWGAQAHAFELDSLVQPSVGVHPGATVALPALAVAQSRRASGRELLTAIVAGFEVLHRIGSATLHTPEKRGFHAPGVVGPFGAAIASGLLMGLPAERLTHALGVAGSLGGGLLAFSKAGQGGMVKRLHMGRAAEAGVLAAQLAADGYEGPETVLDGAFGMLEAFCDERDVARLTADLGSKWQTDSLALKSFACHVTAHAPVHMLRALMRQHRFAGDDIAALTLRVSEKVLTHHASRKPKDIMQVQYSVPYTVALAAYRDPTDPASFSANVISAPEIRRLAETIILEPASKSDGGRAVTGIAVTLHDGRRLEDSAESFPGCSDKPFSADQLKHKFRVLAATSGVAVDRLFDALNRIDELADVRLLWAPLPGAAHRS